MLQIQRIESYIYLMVIYVCKNEGSEINEKKSNYIINIIIGSSYNLFTTIESIWNKTFDSYNRKNISYLAQSREYLSSI